jgi:hypothetical protein
LLSFRELRGGGALLVTLLGAALWGLPAAAGAQRAQLDAPPGSAWLQVERDEHSQNCPDAAALSQQVAALHGAAAATAYVVRFERADGAARALLYARESPTNVRTLTGEGDGCEGLAQAVAVALALLLDASTTPAIEDPAAPAPATPRAEYAASDYAERSYRPDQTLNAAVNVGAGLLLRTTRRVAPALLGEVALEGERFRVALGVLGVPIHRESFGPGSLRTWLLAGEAKGCWVLVEAFILRAELCGGVLAGVIDVRARGYTRNDREKQPWVSAPLELSLRYVYGPLRVRLTFGALIGLRRPDFSIDGLGSAYRSWPVSPLIALRWETDLPPSWYLQKK